MSYQNILAERVESVAIITLNRPEKLNALSYELACELDEELTKIESDDDARRRDPDRRRPARVFFRRRHSSDGQIHARGNGRAHGRSPRSQLAPGDFHQADHRRHQRPRLRRRRATDDDAGHSHRLRARRDSIPRGKIWPRQFHLVPALGRRLCRKQKNCSTPAGRSKPKKRNASGCSIRSCPARNCATPPSKWRKQIGANDPRMVQGIKKLARQRCRHGLARALRRRTERAQRQTEGQLAARRLSKHFSSAKAFAERLQPGFDGGRPKVLYVYLTPRRLVEYICRWIVRLLPPEERV